VPLPANIIVLLMLLYRRRRWMAWGMVAAFLVNSVGSILVELVEPDLFDMPFFMFSMYPFDVPPGKWTRS
jgi:hypothetical protein